MDDSDKNEGVQQLPNQQAQSFSEDVVEPTNQPAQNSVTSSSQTNTDEGAIVLYDSGYLVNLFQRSLKARQITLSLYKSHLKITDTRSGELIEDSAVNEVHVLSRYFRSRLMYTLYGLLIPTTLRLKTPQKKYIISWVNRDKEALLLGGGTASELSSQQNFNKNMLWIKTIKDLQV